MTNRLQVVSFQRKEGILIGTIGGGTEKTQAPDTFEVQVSMESDDGRTFLSGRVTFDIVDPDDKTLADVRELAVEHLKEIIR